MKDDKIIEKAYYDHDSQSIIIKFTNGDVITVPVEDLLDVNEFKDGLTVDSGTTPSGKEIGIVKVLKDPTSERWLTVSINGVKVSGIQAEIDRLDGRIDKEIEDRIADVDEEEARAKAAEAALDAKIDAEIARSTDKDEEHDDQLNILDQRLGLVERQLPDEINQRKERAFADASYDENAKEIVFKNALGVKIDSIDATPFLNDGMVEDVYIDHDTEELVIVWNTQSGQQETRIPLSEIFNPDDYYTKDEIDDKVDEINSAITAVEGDITTIQGDIVDINSAITEIQGDVTTIEGDITNINSSITEINSSITEINEAIDDMEDQYGDEISALTDSVRELEETVENDEFTISMALNDLNTRKLDASAYTPTDLSNYYTKSETDAAVNGAKIDNINIGNDTTTGYPKLLNIENNDGEIKSVDISEFATKDYVDSHEPDLSDYYTKEEIDTSEKVVAMSLNDLEYRKANKIDLDAHTENTDIHVTTTEKSAWNAKAELSDIPSVTQYADSVKYNSTTKYVEFYHGTTAGTKVFEYDASPFLIDGMVESVAVTSVTSGGSDVQVLEITWNSAAGKQVTDIPLSDIFNPDEYYTKDEIDEADRVVAESLNDLNTRKLDASAYTPTDLSNYYTKSETYSKDEVDARDLWVSGTGSDAIVKKNGNNIASGRYSQAEGYGTKATEEGAKAEGFHTEANGAYSHAEGYNTIANNAGEHASGKFNVSNTGLTSAAKTLFSIGNGSGEDSRHNAFEVRENGDIYININGNDVLLQDYITELESVVARALVDLDARLKALEP